MVLVKVVFNSGEVVHIPYKTVQGPHSGKSGHSQEHLSQNKERLGGTQLHQRWIGGHSGPLGWVPDLSPGSKKHCSGSFEWNQSGDPSAAPV